MPFTTITCFTITCDGCGEEVDREEYTPHFPSLERARADLVDELDGEVEYQWEVSADLSTWTCPRCIATQACAAAGGHDWTAWDVYGVTAVRVCRRGACTATERRPITDLEKPL